MSTIDIFGFILILHIAGGLSALLSGLVAMFTAKGLVLHKRAGKIYFWAMATVFLSAVILSIAHQKYFLLMVGFFSFYMTVRGYRILYLKKLHEGQRPAITDWMISGIAGVFILILLMWGIQALMHNSMMGIPGIVFSTIGLVFLISDVRRFSHRPEDKMHWWYGHINSMGGSYISAVTAFVVTNIHLQQFQWTLWVLPSIIGGILIGRAVRKYKLKFSRS
jgi:uncharacterized membrane protein